MRIFFAGLLVSLLVVRPPAVRGCATVGGEGKRIDIAAESALIVWDEKAKRQHFIRRASFSTTEPYFGFLVPTPNPPDVVEVPDRLFTQLEDWTKAEVRRDRKYRSPFAMSASIDGDAVEVLDRLRVGKYQVSILRSAKASALADWLKEHGHVTRPGLAAWLEPYTKAKWTITAFQIAKALEKDRKVSTEAVRMSFTTDRPFFPYSEPADQAEKALPRRLLRVFFVSTARMQGGLEKDAKWPGDAVWANELSAEQRGVLEAHLGKAVPLPEPAWLTVFDDRFAPRPGSSDLFFTPSADQSTLTRPVVVINEVITIPIWVYLSVNVGLIVLLLGLAFFIARRQRRQQVPA